MRKIVTAGSALAVTLALLGAATVHAASRGGAVAALATPLPAPKQQILSGALWKCAGQHCAAASDGSRPVLVCQRVAKTFGPVVRFVTPAGELSNEELSRCNEGS